MTLDTTWTGTVSLSGGNGTSTANANSVTYFSFDVFGNANSTVEISSAGLYCYLSNVDNSFETNILLTGDLTLQNGNSGFAHTFAGTISGSGDITLNRSGGGPNGYTFSNDISGWKGSLNAIANTNNMTLTGKATEVNATITNTDTEKKQTGTLNLTVNSTGNTTTFNKNVTVNKLTGTTAIALGEGVKLTLTGSNEASSISNIQAHSEGNTIELKSGATLNRIAAKSGGNVTLTGQGTYNMSGSPDSNVTGLTNNTWEGKVVVSGNMNGLDFSTLGNAQSTIEVASAGITGYLCADAQTIAASIVMNGNVSLSNGYSTSVKTFTGDVSGSGNFVLQYNGSDDTKAGFFPQAWEFAGDVSSWNGEFAVQDLAGKQASKGTLTFSGTSEINLASIAVKKAEGAEGDARSELHLTISDANQGDTKSAVTAAGTITTTSLTTNTTQGVVLNGDVTTDTLTVQNGTVSGSGNVTVNNNLTLNAAESINLSGNLLFGDSATLTLSDSLVNTIVNGTETSYTLAVAGSGSTGDVTLGNADGWFGENFTGYELKWETYAGPSTLAGEGATEQKALVLTLIEPDSPVTPTTLTTINVSGVDLDSTTAGVLTLTTVENATDAVFGDKLNAVMKLETWNEIKATLAGAGITLDESIAITFVGADGVTFDFDATGTTPVVTINGEGTRDADLNVVNQTLTNNGTTVGNYVTAYIPEPTSTTLSLLALAALAVRRRRR